MGQQYRRPNTPIVRVEDSTQSNVRFGLESEVANYPGVTAVSTSGVVSLDRNRRSSQPAQAAASAAGSIGVYSWGKGAFLDRLRGTCFLNGCSR